MNLVITPEAHRGCFHPEALCKDLKTGPLTLRHSDLQAHSHFNSVRYAGDRLNPDKPEEHFLWLLSVYDLYLHSQFQALQVFHLKMGTSGILVCKLSLLPKVRPSIVFQDSKTG